MIKLPPPVTFEDGQRKLFGILAAIAGVAYGIAALAAVAVVVMGTWPPELAKLRLIIVGISLGGAIIGSIAVTLGLLVGGPVGRIAVDATKDGAKFSASKSSEPDVKVVASASVGTANEDGQ